MSTLSPYLTTPRRPWARALLELQVERRGRRAFPARPAPADGADGHAGQSIRILVADDDEDVRELVRAVLAERNFEVTVAVDANEALQLLSERDFAVLLTDLRMPGMDGLELARAAKQRRPDLRTLFMSGYAAHYRIDPAREDFIAKPFLPHELVGCIYEILSRS
jgi:CheY-like chemotaxis protein